MSVFFLSIRKCFFEQNNITQFFFALALDIGRSGSYRTIHSPGNVRSAAAIGVGHEVAFLGQSRIELEGFTLNELIFCKHYD